MRTAADRPRLHTAVVTLLLPMVLLLLPGCSDDAVQPAPVSRNEIDLVPFKEMAATATCADVRNRLFLIDASLVFWDRAGNCTDAAFGETLFGGAPDQVLCEFHDSINGPVNGCRDARYAELFATLIGNLDKPDLGLGLGHTILPVAF